MTIVDFLKDRATRNADDLAFRFMGNGELDGPITEWTFSELYHQSAGVAEDLVEQGLVGSSVLLAFPPGLDFVKAFYGCLLAGARAVPVPLPNPNSKNPLGRILKTAEACEASTILTNQQLAEIAATMGSELPVCWRAVTFSWPILARSVAAYSACPRMVPCRCLSILSTVIGWAWGLLVVTTSSIG